ncbi:MAG: hypothetical protein A2Y10_14860 [Planctomycetes bacterium GWF2_41_51]|nr:MAG: hypothetical protein A2Y10_14860 [Planctomycetes bacterium GWF2_41_51]HBG28976.1 hypothetical protein [Phycisphaerales bacterium]
MDVEKIAAKLRPLMPDKISQWMKTRELADPELKSLIEKQIISTAYKIFGDFNSKILLSLPSENKSFGPINLGTILYDKEKWPLGLKYGEMIQNTAILGRSGAGKTNVTFHILSQLIERGVPFAFMDWKRTVRHLIPNFNNKLNIYTPGRALSKFPFNPFVVPPGIEANVYVSQLVDVMSQAFTLGDGSRSILRKAIAAIYENGNLCPTAKDIIAELQKVPDSGRMGGWKITALRALESLEFADLSSGDRISQQQLAQKMLYENTVIELDGLAQESKKFLIPLLCLWLYYVRLESQEREKLKLVIFIEEAHHVLHKREQTANETVLEMLFRQCRELGIGIVVIDQHPHLLSSAAMGNTYTTIFLNQKDPSDINKAAAVCLMDSDDKKYFSSLPVGQGIIKLQDRWTSPVYIQFPFIKVNKGSVTDAMLARYSAVNNTKSTGSGRNTFTETYFGQVPRVPQLDIALNDDALRLFIDILNFPMDGIKLRYQRLNMSIGSGDRLKDFLINQGWLLSQTVNIGQTRKVCLRLTKQAYDALNLENIPPQHGSIAHEYWKQYYAQRFAELGYKISFEVPRISGRVDVVAGKNNERIAIEIETGLSNFIRNIRQDLAAKYDKIVVVATDKYAFEKIEKSLAKEGLIIPKIQLEQAGKFTVPA